MADSLHGEILEAAQSMIQGIGLSGVPSANIVIHMVPTDRQKDLPSLPGVVLSPVGTESIPPGGGNNARDEIGYPVRVDIVDKANQDQVFAELDSRLLWRAQIIDTFINYQAAMPSGSCVNRWFVEPGIIVDPAAWGNNVWQSVLALRATTLQTRRQS